MLLLIDLQRNMLEPPDPVADAPAVTEAVSGLLDRARAAGVDVVHVRNNGTGDDPDLPGTPGWELLHATRPGEAVIDKTVPDSFVGTGLGELLPESAALVVAGLASDFCIRATTLAALARGNRVTLAAGAHSTYPDGDRPAAEVVAEVERELVAAGAALVPAGDIRFD